MTTMTHASSQFNSVATSSQLDRLVILVSGKVAAGEPIDLAALTADCPEQREQLEMLLPTLEAIADLGHSIGERKPAHSWEQHHWLARQRPIQRPFRGILGDFRILRELGRGGMGVVYEAEQISLGRRVALKVLPFAAMLDKQQLARFKNEARAAATLDHPNIVPIYSVGCERGVHYYAMQLIEGRTLAEVIADMKPGRPPSARRDSPCGSPRSIMRRAADTAKAALPTVRATRQRRLFDDPSLRLPRILPHRSPASASKPPRPSTTPTKTASSTATSSRPTCCSTTTANSGSPTSAWRASSRTPA